MPNDFPQLRNGRKYDAADHAAREGVPVKHLIAGEKRPRQGHCKWCGQKLFLGRIHYSTLAALVAVCIGAAAIVLMYRVVFS